jgi:hypothetical protein
MDPYYYNNLPLVLRIHPLFKYDLQMHSFLKIKLKIKIRCMGLININIILILKFSI